MTIFNRDLAGRVMGKIKLLKYKIKEARNFMRWVYANLFRKDRVRAIEKSVLSVYLKVLGRTPDDRRRFVKCILEATESSESLENELMRYPEYRERLDRYCRLYGSDPAGLPPKFAPLLFPGDAAFNETGLGYQDRVAGAEPQGTAKGGLVTLVSTWGIKCGIATYTGYLARQIRRSGLLVDVVALHRGKPAGPIDGKIVHFQHEFGIMPDVIAVAQKGLITWHTIKEQMGGALRRFESAGNIVGHIVHSEAAARCLKTAGAAAEIMIVPHGSKPIAPIAKEHARALLGLENLGIGPKDEFGFVFGFQSGNKQVNEIVEAAGRAGIKLVISGAVHQCGHREKVTVEGHVIFLEKYLCDTEIDLWALASDLLLFDYVKQENYSVSGALHRVIGAARPVLCSRTRHFTDVEEDRDVLKFDGPRELEQKIRDGLADKEGWGQKASAYASKTSWECAAAAHLAIYKKYTQLSSIPERFDADYYDRDYFAVKNGKSFQRSDGSIGHWSYANPKGEWSGCEPIVKAWQAIFKPKNVLDVGCGRGTFIGYLRANGIAAVGFDFSGFAVDNPYAKCSKEWIKKWDAVQTPWPYQDRSFDLVIALDLMEHLYEEDIEPVVDQIYRVTGKYTFLQIATVRPGSGPGAHDGGYILKKGQAVPAHLQGCVVAGHTTVCTEDYWMQKLRRSGWVPRKDLVEAFCRITPKDVIANWISNTMIVLEKVS